MQATKDQLIQLIETYCAAKISGNATLVQFAANTLSSFLGGIEITEIPTSDQNSAVKTQKGKE